MPVAESILAKFPKIPGLLSDNWYVVKSAPNDQNQGQRKIPIINEMHGKGQKNILFLTGINTQKPKTKPEDCGLPELGIAFAKFHFICYN